MPLPFTPLEYANMHLIYGECRCNGNAASRLYRERYPNALRYPDYRVFINVHQAFSEGRLPSNRRNAGRPRLEHDEGVLNEIENDATTSVRAIAASTRISKSSVHRILKRQASSLSLQACAVVITARLSITGSFLPRDASKTQRRSSIFR